MLAWKTFWDKTEEQKLNITQELANKEVSFDYIYQIPSSKIDAAIPRHQQTKKPYSITLYQGQCIDPDCIWFLERSHCTNRQAGGMILKYQYHQ